MDVGDFVSFPKSSVGEKIPVPPRKPLKLDDVPMWTMLPYDTKYPLTEYSKKVIAREEVGKSLYHTFPSKEFDLTQSPVPVVDRTAYEPLHDPHLRQYFQHAWRYRNLVRKGLVTKDGKVKSRLQDYNQYRMYLYHLWAMQVNQLNRTQMLEEKKRLENLLKAHESGDSLLKDVAQKYDKIKVDEILDEVTLKMSTDAAVLAKYGWSPLIQSAIQWKMYQEKLKKNFRLSYPAVRQWLCEQTKHYKQFIERKLNARRNRDKKNRGRWERIYENSLARLQKELKLKAREKERKRALSEQRYKRAKSQWAKNAREISSKSKSSISKSLTDLSLSCGGGLREWTKTGVGSTSSPDVSAVKKYSPAQPIKDELQTLNQEKNNDFKQTSTNLTKDFYNGRPKIKSHKLTMNEVIDNNIQSQKCATDTDVNHYRSPSNFKSFTKTNRKTLSDSYQTLDVDTIGKKSKIIKRVPEGETRINKEIVDGEPKQLLNVEEREYLSACVSKELKLRKKEELDSFQSKSITGVVKPMKADYRKELPAQRYFKSNVDQDISPDFESLKKANGTNFVENYQTSDDGAFQKKSESNKIIHEEERKFNKKTQDDPTIEISDVKETEFLSSYVSRETKKGMREVDTFQMKTPKREEEQIKTDYKKDLPTKEYYDSDETPLRTKITAKTIISSEMDEDPLMYQNYLNGLQDTDDRKELSENVNSNVTLAAAKIKRDTNISSETDKDPSKQQDYFNRLQTTEDRKEFLEKRRADSSVTSIEAKIKTETNIPSETGEDPSKKSDYFNRLQTTDDRKEFPEKRYADSEETSSEAKIKKETNIFSGTDEYPSKYRNYLNGLQKTDVRKGFPQKEYESDETTLGNVIDPRDTNFIEKSTDILIDNKKITQKDFARDTSSGTISNQSALGDDQLKLRDYLYGLPELDKKYVTGNEITKSTLGTEKPNIREKSIKKDTKVMEKVDIPTLLKLSLDYLTEKGCKNDNIWTVLEAFIVKKKKNIQKYIGLEKKNLITERIEKTRKILSDISYNFDTESSFGLQYCISQGRETDNTNYNFCLHTDRKRDLNDFGTNITRDRRKTENELMSITLLNKISEIDYIQHKTIVKNCVKQNKIIPDSSEISTRYPIKRFKLDFGIKKLNRIDELALRHFRCRKERGNTSSKEKIREYKMDDDSYSYSKSEGNVTKHINKQTVQMHLNELPEIKHTYKGAAEIREQNKLRNSIYFSEETPQLISETKEYLKSKYLNSEFYKKRKEKLDVVFYDWYLKCKEQSGREAVKAENRLHTKHYSFKENERDLQPLQSSEIKNLNSFEDRLDFLPIHYSPKECKTTLTHLQDTKLDEKVLSSVSKEKINFKGFSKDKKVCKITEHEKCVNIDPKELVTTEDSECKKYIHHTGKTTITDTSNHVQKHKKPYVVPGKIIESQELVKQEDSKPDKIYLKKIIDEIITEVEMKQTNTDVALSDTVLATQSRQNVAHKEKLDYEQLGYAKLRKTEDTSNDVIKTTVNNAASSISERSSETEGRTHERKHFENGIRIIQYPPENVGRLSSHLTHELNVNTKASLEETDLKENLIEKRQDEINIISIPANIEKSKYDSTAMQNVNIKEIQNKITELSSIVDMYEVSIETYPKSTERTEETANTTYELADNKLDEQLNTEDYSVKSHICEPCTSNDTLLERSSLDFKSAISEDPKIYERKLDSEKKDLREERDISRADISQSHLNTLLSQANEFDDYKMKITKIPVKGDEKHKIDRTDIIIASSSHTADGKGSEMEQNGNKTTEDQRNIGFCEDAPLFVLNDQLGFFYNPTEQPVSKKCEITKNMKKWAPANFAGRVSLLKIKNLRKKAKIAEIRDTFLKSDEDFISPSNVRCFDASDNSDMVVEIQTTNMVSFIESRQDRAKNKFGQISEQQKSKTNKLKIKDNIEMHSKAEKMALQPRILDSKYTNTPKDETDNSYCYQIQSDTTCKTTQYQKDEIQKRNYNFFELEEKKGSLTSVTDFLFPAYSIHPKHEIDSTDHQFLCTSFEGLTINDLETMQSKEIEKDIKQSLPAMDILKDKTLSKNITKTEIKHNPQLSDSSNNLAISTNPEIYASSLPQVITENTDLPHTENLINILIMNETNNTLSIPDFEPKNSNFDLIQNTSKYKIDNNLESMNGVHFSPIHVQYESLNADEFPENLTQRCNTGVSSEDITFSSDFQNIDISDSITLKLFDNISFEEFDSSIKYGSQFEIASENSQSKQERVESSQNSIEGNTKNQVVYDDNYLTKEISPQNKPMSNDTSTSPFSFNKTSSNTKNLDSISLNVKFSDLQNNAKLNKNKFKAFLNSCISEIVQKYKMNKSEFFEDDEYDSNTNIAPKNFLEYNSNTDYKDNSRKIESKPHKNKKQHDNSTEESHAIPAKSCKNMPINEQNIEYPTITDRRYGDNTYKNETIHFSENNIFYNLQEGFNNEVKRKDASITEVSNESQISNYQDKKTVNVETEQRKECYVMPENESINYQGRKSFIRKIMDPFAKNKDSSHREKLGRTQHPNTDIFITKDIKSFTDNLKDDSNNFQGASGSNTLPAFPTSSNQENMFETNNKETSTNEKGSKLKMEGLLPIISAARLTNMKIMNIADKRKQNLTYYLQESQEKSIETVDDDPDKK